MLVIVTRQLVLPLMRGQCAQEPGPFQLFPYSGLLPCSLCVPGGLACSAPCAQRPQLRPLQGCLEHLHPLSSQLLSFVPSQHLRCGDRTEELLPGGRGKDSSWAIWTVPGLDTVTWDRGLVVFTLVLKL